MKRFLPGRVREWFYELINPGGSWVSRHQLEKARLAAKGMELPPETALAMLLASFLGEAGHSGVDIQLTGLEYKGEDFGDWIISAERRES